MSLPVPEPGLVIRYSYLWKREADEGREEGVKDRPCAIIVVSLDENQRHRVVVLPITHSPPDDLTTAIEIPPPVKRRLALDEERSWVVVSEANYFLWPGPDLRTLPGRGLDSVSIGFLPPRFFNAVVARFRALYGSRVAPIVLRSE